MNRFDNNYDYVCSNTIEELKNSIKTLMSDYEALIYENEQLKEEIEYLSMYKIKYEEKIEKEHRAGRKAINFTKEEIKNMKKLNESGSSTREIAKTYGCSHTLVNKLIKLHRK